ncbi:heme exporter protein CcmD [Alteromonas flava]|uniref:heme exporter protein CcmD n=1 Tax=Alteromonas flava TaxID=2048003 RepID=UPI000C292B10|nr:heme exporter protein CcmD [Alteromonas flava]
MQFTSFSEFIAMGGYGFFVWLSFGVTVLVMILLVIESLWAKRQLIAQVGVEQARKARIAKARKNSAKNT